MSDIAVRSALSAHAEAHGWTVRLPHQGPTWLFLEAHRHDSQQRIAMRLCVEWSADLPGGCRLVVEDQTAGRRHVFDHADASMVGAVITGCIDSDDLAALDRITTPDNPADIDLTVIDLRDAS